MEIDVVDHKGGGVVMLIPKLLIAKRREVKLSGNYERPSARQERRARAQDPRWHQRMCPVCLAEETFARDIILCC